MEDLAGSLGYENNSVLIANLIIALLIPFVTALVSKTSFAYKGLVSVVLAAVATALTQLMEAGDYSWSRWAVTAIQVAILTAVAQYQVLKPPADKLDEATPGFIGSGE